MGWITLSEQVSLGELQKLADSISKENKIVIVAGIGGAVSGSKALLNALNYMGGKSGRPEIIFLENADAESLSRFENQFISKYGALDYSHVALNIISQSGKTTETLANLEWFLTRMTRSGLTPKEKVIVTTNFRDGILLDFARKHKCVCLDACEKIMGVLGVFGNVGLFPLSLAGNDLTKFIQGVKKGLKRARLSSNSKANYAYRLAEAFYLLDTMKGKDLHGFFMYGDAFKSLADWLEQIWAEGLGKSETIGPRPLTMIGTTAQHSVNQDNIAGKNNKATLFIAAQKSRVDFTMQGESVDYLAGNRMSELLLASMKGTIEALTTRQRPNMTMMLPEINEETLGEFLFTMGMTVHVAARLYGVDPYQQPSVERGKAEVVQALKSLQSKIPV
jgi:glucose-6-phosphate isomerase